MHCDAAENTSALEARVPVASKPPEIRIEPEPIVAAAPDDRVTPPEMVDQLPAAGE